MAATAAGAQATAEGAQPTAPGAAQVAATAAGPQPALPTPLPITAGAQPIPAGAAQLASTAAGAQLAIAAGAAQVAAGAQDEPQLDPQPRLQPPSPPSNPQPRLQRVRWHRCFTHFVRAGRHFERWQQLGAGAQCEGAGAQQLGAGAAHPWLAETSATPAHTNRTAAEKVVHFMSGTTPGKAHLERRLWRTRETQANRAVTNRLQGGGLVASLAT